MSLFNQVLFLSGNIDNSEKLLKTYLFFAILSYEIILIKIVYYFSAFDIVDV